MTFAQRKPLRINASAFVQIFRVMHSETRRCARRFYQISVNARSENKQPRASSFARLLWRVVCLLRLGGGARSAALAYPTPKVASLRPRRGAEQIYVEFPSTLIDGHPAITQADGAMLGFGSGDEVRVRHSNGREVAG